MPDRIDIPIVVECIGCRKKMKRIGDRLGEYGTIHKCHECGRIIEARAEEKK